MAVYLNCDAETGQPAARVGDSVSCPKHGTVTIVSGCNSVFHNDQLAARVGDKAIVKPIVVAEAEKLVVKSPDEIATLIKTKNRVELYNGQFFKVTKQSRAFYIISGKRNSADDNPTTCTVLLFDQSGTVKSVFDVVGPDDEKRFWYCDYVEAMSFKDYYPDGSLKIIGMYRGTAPSSEHFILPVIMKLDFNTPSLKIDEELTSKLEDTDVKTIQGVRSYFKKHEKK
jgi:PAAR motif